MPISDGDPRNEPTALIELLAPPPAEILEDTPPGMVVPEDREHGGRAGGFVAEAHTEEPPDFIAFQHRLAA